MRSSLSSLLFALTLATLPLRATDVTDASLWQYHLSYHNATQTLSVGNVTYALFNGNLLSYNAEDESVTTYDKLTSGLSDKDITHMGYSAPQKCLVLLYENRNIDLLYEDGMVVNLPQMKNFAEYDIAPQNLTVHQGWATVSTAEGVVLIDLERQEIRAYYRIGQNVSAAIVLDGTLFAALDDRVISGSITGNLYDISQWQTYQSGMTATQFVGLDNSAYAMVPFVQGVTNGYSGLCHIAAPDEAGTRRLTRVTDAVYETGTVNAGRVTFAGSAYLMDFDAAQPTQSLFFIPTEKKPASVSRTADGTYYFALADEGLRACTVNAEQTAVAETGEVVGNFGPRQDLAYSLRLSDGTLYVSGGEPSYLDRRTTGFFGRYRNGTWDDMDQAAAEAAVLAAVGMQDRYVNMQAAAVDPLDAAHVFSTSYGVGLFEYQDGKFQTLYNLSNSPLVSAVEGNNRYIRLGSSAFDTEGNLWINQNYGDSALVVLRHGGTWQKVAVPNLEDARMMDKILFDSRGYIWINLRENTLHGSGGLVGFDYGGTVATTSDDQARVRSSAANEDGTTCTIDEVKDVVEDRNGQIWFGCTQGVFAVTDVESWFTNSFSVYQPKVPRNDGTNYADYLLTGITVNAIAVDGGNRKWIGTIGSGLYLVSEDGSEVIAQYTTENSPILSDNIKSLCLDNATGLLYIGTDLGLCTYLTGVTDPEPALSESAVKVYPNPVRPEYSGRITVSGLTDGAEVKILSTGSQLVARGNATGGSFLWDGRSSASGRRVAPGVYYILVATADGKESVAAKIVVI